MQVIKNRNNNNNTQIAFARVCASVPHIEAHKEISVVSYFTLPVDRIN